MSNKTLILDGESLTLNSILNHVKNNTPIRVPDSCWHKIRNSYNYFKNISEIDIPCYGINTNLGALIDYKITHEFESEFQNRVILTHAVGWKDKLSIELSKTVFLLRINCLVKGASGVSPNLIKLMIKLYNENAIPEIYSTGSLGASGDLAPLSHLAAFLIGHGYGYLNGKRFKSKEIFKKLNLTPIKLKRKESLSLINGTSAMTAVGIYVIQRFNLYFQLMLIGMGMIMDSNSISHAFLNIKAFNLKPHIGSNWIAQYLWKIIKLSKDKIIINNLQPVYSFRCVPFILSEVFETLKKAEKTLLIESNSVNDNPLFIEGDSEPYHGGHFHGHVVSVVMDQLRLSIAHISGIIDRQLEHIMNEKSSCNISPFLSINPSQGYCGLEGAQYLVTSLNVENLKLSTPFSTYSKSTNAGNQDYVSLGLQSCLAGLQMADNLKAILVVYFVSAVQSYSLLNKKPNNEIFRFIIDSIQSQFKFPYSDDIMFSELIDSFSNDEQFESWFDNACDILNIK